PPVTQNIQNLILPPFKSLAFQAGINTLLSTLPRNTARVMFREALHYNYTAFLLLRKPQMLL
ncbi:MAG: hypothetical protein FWB96_00655, partial [Defluviitaleaceae bacterium]|nr:hypothetical protein [Defluviitaleaceae bacterium]MCL2262720.1 hypothetical protein [Defluviitaleaceae bacterium]